MPSKRSGAPRSPSINPTFPNDWHEFLSLLTSHEVKFVVVGAHAFAIHGRPRMTEALDIFVEASQANAGRLRNVLMAFGFGSAAPDAALLAEPQRVFMLGAKPYRIDLLTFISGLSFAAAWRGRVMVETSAGPVPFISKRLFIKNKRASGRPKDLLDLEALRGPR
jgi:hypothetical protein